jgi:hypothetical protein
MKKGSSYSLREGRAVQNAALPALFSDMSFPSAVGIKHKKYFAQGVFE